MNKIITAIAMLVSAAVYSQVGIDTEAPKATLDVKGKPSDLTKPDGVIMPRLKGSELKAKDALYDADQNSAIVYVSEALAEADTSSKTVNVTSIGYYYYDAPNNVWVKMNASNAGNNDWSLTGNSGTTGGTNFIGTTDAVDFVIKTYNTERERTYKTTNANNTIKEIKGGDLSLNGLTIGRGKGNQPTNTIVGQKSLDGNTTGKNNVALGYYAINSNTIGSSNVSVGHSSLSSNTEGGYNTALGQSSLTFNITGTNNVAIGASALSSPENTTGNKNIGIGASAGNGLKNGASNNIVIGSDQRLKNDTDSNQLNIGGAIFGTGLTGTEASPAGNIGIGTTTPATKLEVNNGTTNGAIKIVDGTEGAGKVLTSDANGLATWQTPSAQSGNDWSLLGNSGTNAGTNFIGTADSQDFVVKTNNTEKERTYTIVNSQNEIKKISGGNLNVNGVSVGTGNNNDINSVAVGNNALKINTNGAQNVAVGAVVLSKNTDGYGNVAVGMSALPNNVSGYENVAVGQNALYGNKTGSNNVAVGKSALGNFNNNSGMNNVAIGQQSGELLQSGNSNIVIGSNQNLGSNNGSNQLNIGGAIFGTGLTGTEAAPAGNIGIGTTTPATKLEVNNGTTNGAIKIVDGTQGEGKVLTSDANGVGTWRTSVAVKTTALGVFPSSNITTLSDNNSGSTDQYKYTGVYIDLNPGKWVINTGMTLYCFKANLTHFQHAYLSNSQTAVAQNDFQNLGPGASVAFAGKISNGPVEGVDADPQRNANFISGSSVINVSQPTRIYLLLENKPDLYWSYSTSAWENYFYAVPVN